MRKSIIIFICIISIIFALIPIVVYWQNFTNYENLSQYSFYKLSKSNGNWGDFGSFLSGTTGAIFSFFSLIAVLYSLNVTQKMSILQLKLSRDEQLTNEFNLLLDVLINSIRNKKYPDIHNHPADFDIFKKLNYANIDILAQRDTLWTDKFNYIYLLVQARNVIEPNAVMMFKQERDIYSVLLARISQASDSLAEAFLAILCAKVNEDHIFFLNAQHLAMNEDYQSHRLFLSGIPSIIPRDLEILLLKHFKKQ
ncbi:hypothetical protein ACCW94_21955 [Enterobacter soli]|uniref:hypothetical protein n=1 Tax=Enterobacter soli TaxID=885040 RepID=UPI003ED985EF